ncbi:NACHT, LRR and PYD domains-containing protein 3-like [Mobula birostris]|uniref:NACHT, LRR and PYD domains-containing protein 3-like n=1 Tax=Mobula birostris TaxID=1983395 RepID=UPI003B27BCBB
MERQFDQTVGKCVLIQTADYATGQLEEEIPDIECRWRPANIREIHAAEQSDSQHQAPGPRLKVIRPKEQIPSEPEKQPSRFVILDSPSLIGSICRIVSEALPPLYDAARSKPFPTAFTLDLHKQEIISFLTAARRGEPPATAGTGAVSALCRRFSEAPSVAGDHKAALPCFLDGTCRGQSGLWDLHTEPPEMSGRSAPVVLFLRRRGDEAVMLGPHQFFACLDKAVQGSVFLCPKTLSRCRVPACPSLSFVFSSSSGASPSPGVLSPSRGKLNWVQEVLKRFIPGGSPREADRDTVPKQDRIESNVSVECSPTAEEGEQSQLRDSGIGDTDQNPGTGASEATVCQLGSSLNTELSSPQQGPDSLFIFTEPVFTISDLLAQGGEDRLYQLTKFYRDRLEQAIEEKVERLGWMLTEEGHFSREENEKVTELTENGNRTESSTLFLSLVMGKGSRVRRAMWESFMTWRTELPKLDKVLKEIQELGPDLQEYLYIARGLSELPTQLIDVQQKHKETLRAQTEALRVNTILMREKVKVFQLVDRYAELTVISTVRERRLVEHELLARGRVHEEWRQKHLRQELEKIQTDQLFQSSFSRNKCKSGSSATVAGVPGIGKTTMVQKIVYDWATGTIYQQFQFVFSFKFRELNSINTRINLRELILDQYPYFGNILREVWKNPEGLLFIFDGLDEFKHKIDFADSRRDTEPKHQCPDPEWWCEVSDIVYSLIQHKLLPGCSVLVTSRPTALHLLEKAEISVWAEILGFVGEERKEYFIKYFEEQTVAAAVFKHVEENEILYTMSYNPSYCWILALALGPFFTQRDRDPQRVPKTITQLYSYYIYNILKNHGREIENPRDVFLSVGQMAFSGVSKNKIVFTDADLINYDLQPSQFLSGFLMELLEREDSARCVVYTFPHLTIQEFVAAVAKFLTLRPRKILKFLTEAHSTTDGRFEVFLRFIAGLSSPVTARGLEEFLGSFPHETTCRVIDWVREEVKRQSGNTWSETGKRSLLNALHYLFESQNRGLVQAAMRSVETLSFRGMTLTPIDCAVLSHVIGLCDTIKHLDLWNCHIQCEGIQRLGPGLYKCQELSLGMNELGDSGVKLVSAALRNPECKIQKLWLRDVGLTDSGAEDLVFALSTKPSLRELNLISNSLTDRSVPALRRLILTNPNMKWIELYGNQFSRTGKKELRSLQEPRLGLRVDL